MTLVWGNHGPTTNVYIAKMTDCPLPVRHTAVVPSDAMVFVFFCFFFKAKWYSPLFTKDRTASNEHVSDKHQVPTYFS